VPPLTVQFLAVGAGGDKEIAWLGWGQAGSWLGALSRLLGDTDSCMTPTEEKNYPGNIAAPPAGKGMVHHGAADAGTRGWD